MEKTIPRESAAQLLTLELQRYDALLETFMPKARRGDKQAAELVLNIEHERSRLCGLHPRPNTPLIFNATLNAESDSGFELTFVRPDVLLIRQQNRTDGLRRPK
jgi:hypothetical protein